MILQMFVIRDAKADTFMNPMFLIAAGQAVRAFSDQVNRADPDNALFHHPEDFELFALGTFDTDSAVFSLLPRPQSLALASNLKLNGSK